MHTSSIIINWLWQKLKLLQLQIWACLIQMENAILFSYLHECCSNSLMSVRLLTCCVIYRFTRSHKPIMTSGRN